MESLHISIVVLYSYWSYCFHWNYKSYCFHWNYIYVQPKPILLWWLCPHTTKTHLYANTI